jgi:tetratricopeptide (TPR) repeat protein
VRCVFDFDSHDARVLAFCGQLLVMTLGRLQEGAAHLDQAVQINPNLAVALTYRGASRIALGMPEAAIDDLERALRLSPIERGRFYALTLLARAHTLCGHPEKALAPAGESLRLRPNFPPATIDSIVAHAFAGDLDTARALVATHAVAQPGAGIATFRKTTRHLSGKGIDKYVEGLRIAGMPE